MPKNYAKTFVNNPAVQVVSAVALLALAGILGYKAYLYVKGARGAELTTNEVGFTQVF